jgi:hypothetical protein
MGEFSVISTRNVSGLDEYQKLGDCEGKSSSTLVIIIPFGTPTLKEAIDNCIKKYDKGEFLVNARTSTYAWYMFLIGGKGFKVKGDVYGRR